MGLISQRVEAAREGCNPTVICHMPSGWAVIGDTQFLPGYSLLLPDPVVGSLNDLAPEERALYLRDMGIIGDAILAITGCLRINYEILGNTEPELHAHCFARYADEPEDRRKLPIWGYFTDGLAAKAPFTEEAHGELKRRLAQEIQRRLAAS